MIEEMLRIKKEGKPKEEVKADDDENEMEELKEIGLKEAKEILLKDVEDKL